MNRRWLSVAVLAVLAATATRAQRHHDPMTSTDPRAGAAPAGFVASTAKPFDPLMDDAISVMHRGMDDASRSGDPDRDFVTLMIPHHQGAIDMAKVLLLYGEDEQLRRLAQEIIVDQQNEVALMRVWLAAHPSHG